MRSWSSPASARTTSGESPARAEIVRVIYPILNPEFAELVKSPLDHPWFAAGQPGVLLAVGRLTPQKDFATLIRAFAVVRRQQDLRLLILGEGEMRGELENLVQELGVTDCVAMPGRVQNVAAYMARCALFVLSSIFEAMPMVIVEALAAGTGGGHGLPLRSPRDSSRRQVWPPGSAGRSGRRWPAPSASRCRNRAGPPAESLQPFAGDTVIGQYLHLITEVSDVSHA